MIATAVRRATGRQPRALVLDWAFSLPWVGVGRPAHAAASRPRRPTPLALLEAGHAVVVFPEGAKGLGKPWRSRYRLERFGRGGFVEVALRTGAPIVPCAVVGSEEIHPKLAELPVVARLLGAPYVPVTPTFPLLGPLGLVPLPSRWRIAFGAPVDLGRRTGREDADDAALVLELAEAVRARMQEMVYEELVQRGGAFP